MGPSDAPGGFKLFVGGIPFIWEDHHLSDYFMKLGPVTSAKVCCAAPPHIRVSLTFACQPSRFGNLGKRTKPWVTSGMCRSFSKRTVAPVRASRAALVLLHTRIPKMASAPLLI